jgi:hypothetical protein
MIEDHGLITCSIDTGDVTELEIHTVFAFSEDGTFPKPRTGAETDGAPTALAKSVENSLVSQLHCSERSEAPVPAGGFEGQPRDDDDDESIGNPRCMMRCMCASSCELVMYEGGICDGQTCRGLRRRPWPHLLTRRRRTARTRRSASRTSSWPAGTRAGGGWRCDCRLACAHVGVAGCTRL